MNFRTVLLFLALVSVSGGLFAQDKIYKRDGEVLDAKVKTVGIKSIVYVRFDNQSGPEYTLAKNDVSKIKYQNGQEDVLEEYRPGPHRHMRGHRPMTEEKEPKVKYSANILSLAPVQFSENGLGFSLGYERNLDPAAGIISFYFPVIATYNLNSHTYLNTSTGTMQNGHTDAMYYFMPGVKFYPSGSYGRVKYSIGPSIVYATGEKSQESYDPLNGMAVYRTQTHTLIGMMLINSLNINPSEKLYLGLEFGLGFSYLNQLDGLNQNSNAIVQGGFKFGYRF
jgi:hypothetical protein